MNLGMQSAILTYVKENISKYKALRVEWFGGEPLCAVNVIDDLSSEFIKICKENRIPYYSSMTTNAYLLDLDIFSRMFKKNKILKYQITIDGLKETHDKQRYLVNKEGTFERILNNLINIRDNVDSKFFNIVIRCNITKELLEKFDGYVKLISCEFGNDPRFEVLWKIAWNPEDLGCSFYETEGNYCKQDDLHICLQKYKNEILRFGTNKSQLMKFGNICYASNKNSLVIGSDGKIYKCTVAFDKDINNIGRLNLNGTIELDNNKMKYWTTRKGCTKKEVCSNCNVYPSCLGIYCNLNNEDNNGNFVCAGLKTYIDDYLQYISKINYFVEDLSELY